MLETFMLNGAGRLNVAGFVIPGPGRVWWLAEHVLDHQERRMSVLRGQAQHSGNRHCVAHAHVYARGSVAGQALEHSLETHVDKNDRQNNLETQGEAEEKMSWNRMSLEKPPL